MFTGPWELHVDKYNVVIYLLRQISVRYSVLNKACVLLSRLKRHHKKKKTIDNLFQKIDIRDWFSKRKSHCSIVL